jgi:hypothetical protein
MTVAAVGLQAVSTGVNSVTVNPSAIGDVLVLVGTDGGGNGRITSVAGGGVETWTLLAGGETTSYSSIWWGVIMTAGVAQLTVSNPNGVYTGACLAVQQFTGGAGGTWSSDGSGSSKGTTGTSGTYPSLVPSYDGELYVGVLKAFGGSPGGSTSGFTYDNPVGGVGEEANTSFVYATTTTAGSALDPGWTQTSSTTWGTSAGLLIYSSITPTYSIAFDPNGGSGTMPTVITSAPVTLPLNVYTYTGWIFTGWNTAADGSGVPATDGETFEFLFANVTLYAQWTSVAPPSAPTLSAPANASYADVSGGIVLGPASYNSTSGDAMEAYALRIKTSGGSYGYWDGTDFSNTSPVWNTLSVDAGSFWSVTIGAAILSNGNVYNWSMASQDTSGAQGAFASDFTFTSLAAPTLSVTAPTGTDTTSSDPTVSWTETLPGGAAQIGYEVIVESGAYSTVPGSGTQAWDSGVVSSSSLSTTIGVLLNSPLTYRVFVQITETGGITSAWEYTTFNLAVTAPVAPTFTATPGVDGVTGAPLVTLSVTSANSGWSAGALTFDLTFSDDGVNWYPVRNSTAVPIGNTATVTVIDYEGPLGFTRQYSAQLVSG